MVYPDDEEREWLQELNQEATRRNIQNKIFPIADGDRLNLLYGRGALDGWMEAYSEGLTPAEALDRAGLKAGHSDLASGRL